MRKKVWIVLIVAVAALAGGWLVWREAQHTSPTALPSGPKATENPGRAWFNGGGGRSGSGPIGNQIPAESFVRTWEEAIADAHAKQMPKEAQLAIYRQLLRSVPHAEYARLVTPLVTRQGADPVILDAFWSDLQARPPDPKFPVLAELALAPEGPLAPVATEILKEAMGGTLPPEPAKLREAARTLTTAK
jgi:hypothetical protein